MGARPIRVEPKSTASAPKTATRVSTTALETSGPPSLAWTGGRWAIFLRTEAALFGTAAARCPAAPAICLGVRRWAAATSVWPTAFVA